VRGLIKTQFERASSSSPVRRIMRRRVIGKRLILAYHGVIPHTASGAGERGLFIGERDFADHLDMLSTLAEVVPLAALDTGDNGRPRVAITLDDAYSGAVNEGVRELAKRSLPATIFAAPGRLNGHVFWWDALADGKGKLDNAVRNHALHVLKGADEEVRAWARESGLPTSDALPPYARSASVGELAAALEYPGITVGSHSWSHRNLACLELADIIRDARRSRAWLHAQFGDKAIDWFAYPYGLRSDAAFRALADASYVGALRIGGGWHRTSDVQAFDRPRLNVPANMSVAGLRARLVGVLA